MVEDEIEIAKVFELTSKTAVSSWVEIKRPVSPEEPTLSLRSQYSTFLNQARLVFKACRLLIVKIKFDYRSNFCLNKPNRF